MVHRPVVAVEAGTEVKTADTCGEGTRDPRDRPIRVQTTQTTTKTGITDNTTTIMIGTLDKLFFVTKIPFIIK